MKHKSYKHMASCLGFHHMVKFIHMKKITSNTFNYLVIATCAALLATYVYLQQFQVVWAKAVVSSESIRVTEVNACQADSDEVATPHFSGCSSIL